MIPVRPYKTGRVALPVFFRLGVYVYVIIGILYS